MSSFYLSNHTKGVGYRTRIHKSNMQQSWLHRGGEASEYGRERAPEATMGASSRTGRGRPSSLARYILVTDARATATAYHSVPACAQASLAASRPAVKTPATSESGRMYFTTMRQCILQPDCSA